MLLRNCVALLILFFVGMIDEHELTADATQNNEVCAIGSLDGLKLTELISKASSNSRCFVEARNAFKRVYSKVNFYIGGPMLDKTNGVTRVNKQIIRMTNFDAVLSTLKLFGDMVQYIDISFASLTKEQVDLISKYLSDYCAESLIEFYLRNCHGHVLDKLKNSFAMVNITAFSTHQSKTLDVHSNTSKLNKLYPSLKRLDVNIVRVDDWKLIGDEFPNLISLAVVIPTPKSIALPDIETVLNNSRKITTLKLAYTSLDILKVASEILPQLRILQLTEFAVNSYIGESINFTNVENLRIISIGHNPQVPEKLRFNQLRSLSLTLGTNFTDKWIKFIETSPNLEIIEIKLNSIKEEQLKQIAAYQTNLRWASITSDMKVPTNGIIGFLETSKHLAWLKVQCDLIDVEERNMLEGHLQQIWYIEYTDVTDESNGILFTRLEMSSIGSRANFESISSLVLILCTFVLTMHI